jgi:hypothetical protein
LELIDIAVFENAGGERQLLGGAVNKERAFHELATIIAGENAFAFKMGSAVTLRPPRIGILPTFPEVVTLPSSPRPETTPSPVR